MAQIQALFASTTKEEHDDNTQIVSVQEDNPQMGGIEQDLESQKQIPLKPSAWPLLPPLIKFLNDITKQDLASDLFPIGVPSVDRLSSHASTRSSIVRTLLSFLTAHDYSKLCRLSTLFYSRQSTMPLFAQRPLVLKYLFQIGNYDCHVANKSRLRASIWLRTLLTGDDRIHDFISKWTYQEIIRKIHNVKISPNTNRPQNIAGMTESENDLVC